MTKIIIAIISLAIFTGCSGFIHTKKTESDQIHKGISYYLPKRQHRLIVTTELLEVSKEKDAYEKALVVYKEFAVETNKLKSEWEKLQSIADNTPAGGKAKDDAVKAAQTAEGKYRAADLITNSDNKASAKSKLKEAEDRYSTAQRIDSENKEIKEAQETQETQCNFYTTMNISPLPLEPDTRHLFNLELNHSIFRDDKMVIETTPSGLITNDADITTTDRTGDIIVEIAKAVAMFGLVPAPLSTGITTYTTVTKEKTPSCYPFKLVFDTITDFEKDIDNVTLSYNGYKPDESRHLIPKLKVKISGPKVSLKTVVDKMPELAKKCSPPNWSEDCNKYNGILYRRDQTHVVELRLMPQNKENSKSTPPQGADENTQESNVKQEDGSKDNAQNSKEDNNTGEDSGVDKTENEVVIASAIISMPNVSPVSLIPADSLFLVTTKNIATFKDGMLVKFNTDQPSQALEVVRLPARVLRGMLEAVTELVQLKINHTSEQGKLVDAINTLKGKLNQQDTGTAGSADGAVIE